MRQLRKSERRLWKLKNYIFAVKIYRHYLCDTVRREDHSCRLLLLRDPVDRSIRIDELYGDKELERLWEARASKIRGVTGRNRVIIGLLVNQALLDRTTSSVTVNETKHNNQTFIFMLRLYQTPNYPSMGADQLRTTLIQQIQNGDESFLRVVSAVAEAYQREHAQGEIDEEIIGYQAGKEMSVRQLKNRVSVAEDQIVRGEYLTAEELEKETEEWLSSIE